MSEQVFMMLPDIHIHNSLIDPMKMDESQYASFTSAQGATNAAVML